MAGTQSIATAYVQILPSTQGIGSGIAGALGGSVVASEMSGAGAVLGGSLGAGIAQTLNKLGFGNVAKFLGIAGLTAGIIDFGKASVQTGMQFDFAMSQVYALMSRANGGMGLTNDEMLTLRDRAREMGATTQYTASEVADAMSFMALAGWKVDEVYENIPAVLQLAAASNMDLKQASDIVTDYMGAFSNTAPTALELVDLLAYAQASSNATTAQFAEAWKYSAGMMNLAGQSAETTTAILMRMANQGHKNSTAGVELNAVMSEMVKSMDAVGNVRMNGMVIPLKDAEGNFRNMIDVFADMQMALGGFDNADAQAVADYMQTVDDAFKDADFDDPAVAASYREAMEAIADPAKGFSSGSVGYMNAILGSFKNVRSIRGIAAILNGDVQTLRDYEAALYGAGGTAAEQMETRTDNLASDLKILNSALDELKIAISDHLTPVIRDFVQALTPIINWLAARVAGKTPLGEAAKEAEQLGAEDWQGIGEKIQTCMDTLYNPDASDEEKFEAAQYLQQQMGIIANMDWTGTGADAIAGIMSGITGYNFHGDAAALLMSMQGAIDREFGISSPATAMEPTGQYVSAGIAQGLAAYDFSADGITVLAAIQAAINAALAIADWTIPAGLIGSGIARGINARRAPVISAAAGLVTAAKSRMSSLIGPSGSKFVPLGEDIAKGMAKGIRDGSSYVLKAIQDLINAALKGAEKDIERGSPSHLFAREIGAPISQGVGMGIRDAVGDPLSAMTDMMNTLSDVTAAEFMGEGSMPARGGYVFNQTVNSPRALSPWEVARQARNATRQMAEAMA